MRTVTVDLETNPMWRTEIYKVDKSGVVLKIPNFILGMKMAKMPNERPPDLLHNRFSASQTLSASFGSQSSRGKRGFRAYLLGRLE
ncbi:hypothetical protein ASG93_25555 [Paenibacillus sp. Soil787]|nr:hypothetical protein ASG93_25555 [Paenibacillus sp. Soil787]